MERGTEIEQLRRDIEAKLAHQAELSEHYVQEQISKYLEGHVAEEQARMHFVLVSQLMEYVDTQIAGHERRAAAISFCGLVAMFVVLFGAVVYVFK